MNTNKFFNFVMALIFLFSLVGSPASVSAQEPQPHKVGLITDESGVDDMGFNWLAYQGLLQAESDLGVDGTLYQVSGSNYAALLQQCVDDGNELCIAVGFLFGASLAGVARSNPDTEWGIVDYAYPDCWEGAVEGVDCGSFTEISNIRGIKFDEKQVGYLAGALAGKMTTSNVIGTIGGMDIPPVTAFMDGYRNGAQCANTNVNVLMNYTGTFIDPDLGAAVAEDMMQDGADVIFGVAGPTGNGAILYSSQHEVWSIGIDTDQYLSVFGNGTVDGSDKLLSSAMKNLDNGVYQTIEDYINGGFSSGTVTYHLTDGGVGLAPYHETDNDISPGVKDYVDGVKAGIINGNININEPCRTAIYGTLKDSAGDPIHNAIQVRAVKVSDGSEVGATLSHSLDGTYSLVNLPLDEPLVVVASDENPDNDGYALRYYNDVSEMNWAENITLTSGSPLRTGIDLRLTGGGTAIEHLTFNVNAGRLLSDVAIRKAIAYGTEREAILKDAFMANGDTGEVVNNMVLPGMWYEASAVDPLLTVYDFNPSTARDLLTAAGWADIDADGIRENAMNEELTLDFVTTSIVRRVTSANLFKSQMADIGVNVNVTTYTGADFFSGDPARSPLASGDFDIAEFAWIINDDDTLLSVHHTGDPQNLGGYSNSTLDGYLDDAKSAKVAGFSVDFKENALNWQYEFSEDLPALPMFTRETSSAPVNNPNFQVRANNDQVEAWDWPLNSELTVRVYVSGTESPTADYTSNPATVTGPAPWGDPRNYVSFDLNNKFDINPGYLVTVTNADGTLKKETIVTTLAFDVMDTDTDTVTGFAPANANVDLWACDNSGNCVNRHVVASDPDGTWIANWGVWGPYPGESNTFDIVPGTWVDSVQNDNDGDGTMFGLSLPNPSIGVRANDDRVEGWQWTVDSIVTVTVDDPNTPAEPDVTRAVQVYEASWNPGEYRFDLNLSDVIDIQPGFEVTATAGSVIKRHVVTSLAFTNIDIDLDLVTGVAAPESRVDIWACDKSTCINRHVNANAGGIWTADFAHFGDESDEQNIFPIVPGTWVDSSQGDEDGDNTMFGQNVPDPRIEVSYEHDWIQIRDFTRGGEVTYTIYDHQGGHALFGPVTGPVDSHGDGWISYNLHRTDLIPGNFVTAVDETTGEEVSVLIRNINLDYIGADDDRVLGTAEPNTTIDLHVSGSHDQGFNLTVDVNSLGYWEVDLAAEGHPIDGYRHASANLYDAEGDAIIAQSPWIDAQISTDSFGTTNFSKNADVTLTLYNAPGGTILYGPVTQRTEGSGNTWVNLWESGIDLVPGNYIVAYDHTLNFTKSLEVEPFDFMELNAADDTVSGTAAVGEWVDLHVESLFSNWGLDALTDQNNQWFRDYGLEDYDITEQMWANGWAVDDQGNRSHDHTTGLPGLEVSIADDWISGYNFSPDRQVRIRIYASEGGNLLAALGDPLADILVTAQGNTQFYVDYWQHRVDLQAGMYILAEDLETGKTSALNLIRLTFDGVDYDADTAWGTAEPFARVVVRASHLFDSYEITVDADEFGDWSANFSLYGADITSEWDLRAMVFDLEFDATVAQAPKPPVFTASLNGDWVNGNNWAAANNVSIQVYEYEGGPSIAGPFTWGTDNYGNFNANLWNEGVDLLPGNYVTVTDNFSGGVKSLTLPNLAINYLDPDLEVAGGLAPPDTRISVQFNNQLEGVQFDLFSASDGTWEADFAAYDFDLTPGSNGNVRILDEDGDTVQVDGRVLNPFLITFPENDAVEGWEWTDRTTVHLNIDDPATPQSPDLIREGVVAVTTWGDPRTYIRFDFGDEYDLKVGDIVTVTDGITPRTHVVLNLSVTAANAATDTITGQANPGSVVIVWPHEYDQVATVQVTTGEDGTWLANLTGLHDLVAGTGGRSEILDEAGNATAVDWNVPNPTIGGRPNEDQIEGWGWPIDATVAIEINDPDTPENPDHIASAISKPADWDPNQTYFYIDLDGFDLQPSDVITAAYGTTTKTHITTGIAITFVDLEADKISGIVLPNARVYVWIHGPVCCINRNVVADQNGYWVADFSVPGDEDWETQTFDIQSGASGQAAQPDDDEDLTSIYWQAPGEPRIEVYPLDDDIVGADWPVDSEVTLTIDDPATQNPADYTATQTVHPLGFEDKDTVVAFRLAGFFDIQPGITVTLSDGSTTKTHIVTNLKVNTVAQDTEIVSGETTPESNVTVKTCGPRGIADCITRYEVSDDYGHWIANLSEVGNEGYEQNTFDLRPGVYGTTSQFDEDGNGTVIRLAVVTPPPPDFTPTDTVTIPADGSIQLATVVDLSQNSEQLGSELINAVQMAIDDFGQIYGFNITQDTFDSDCNNDFITAQTAALNVIANPQYAGVVGHPCSFSFAAGLPLYQVAGLVTVSGSSTGFDTPLFGPDVSNRVTLNDYYTPDTWANSLQTLPDVQTWRDRYETIFGASPGVFAVLFYDAATLLLTRIAEESELQPGGALVINRADLASAVRATQNYEGITGCFSLDGRGDRLLGEGDCNQPPVIEQVTAPVEPVQIGQTVTAAVTFDDPNSADTHTALWGWGDGSTTTISAALPTASAFHNYASPGVYTVTVTITDAAGESDTASFQYVVIYDPNGGFVTGGGWINSPVGAYTANPTLTGKATFGFVSKYQKGANIPTGNTEFQFKVADLNFKSTSYDWLVIAGAKAQYKGTGTINGTGEFKFMLTAIDGTPDKFRIKIWDKSTGEVIYDNQLDAADDANPTMAIQGGSIVIHKEK